MKLQIITLAAKLLVLSPTDRTIGLLNRYIFSLARYDLNYDVRDRARMLSSLLIGVAPSFLAPDDETTPAEERGGVVLRNEQVKLVLFNGKATVAESDHSGMHYGVFILTFIDTFSRANQLGDRLPQYYYW